MKGKKKINLKQIIFRISQIFLILTSIGPGLKGKKLLQNKYLGEEASNLLLQMVTFICTENTLILACFLSKKS